MIDLPDRLLALVTRIEAGQPVTQSDIDRVAALQALDLARHGRQFVEEWAAREDEHTNAMVQNG